MISFLVVCAFSLASASKYERIEDNIEHYRKLTQEKGFWAPVYELAYEFDHSDRPKFFFSGRGHSPLPLVHFVTDKRDYVLDCENIQESWNLDENAAYLNRSGMQKIFKNNKEPFGCVRYCQNEEGRRIYDLVVERLKHQGTKDSSRISNSKNNPKSNPNKQLQEDTRKGASKYTDSIPVMIKKAGAKDLDEYLQSSNQNYVPIRAEYNRSGNQDRQSLNQNISSHHSSDSLESISNQPEISNNQLSETDRLVELTKISLQQELKRLLAQDKEIKNLLGVQQDTIDYFKQRSFNLRQERDHFAHLAAEGKRDLEREMQRIDDQHKPPALQNQQQHATKPVEEVVLDNDFRRFERIQSSTELKNRFKTDVSVKDAIGQNLKSGTAPGDADTRILKHAKASQKQTQSKKQLPVDPDHALPLRPQFGNTQKK